MSLATPEAHASAIGAPGRNGNRTARGLLRCASVPESGSRIRTPNSVCTLRCPKVAAAFGAEHDFLYCGFSDARLASRDQHINVLRFLPFRHTAEDGVKFAKIPVSLL